jgi:hypothetical protein
MASTARVVAGSPVVREIGTGTRFKGVLERVPSPATLEELKRCDVIIGCVDTLHARSDLQEIAWRFMIPYVDVGISIRALKPRRPSSPRVAIGGNVLTMIPGGFCMWCSCILTEEKLKAELDGPNRSLSPERVRRASGCQPERDRRRRRRHRGPSASHRLSRGKRRSTRLAPRAAGRATRVLKLDGFRGTLVDWGARRRPSFPKCAELLARGAVAWRRAA